MKPRLAHLIAAFLLTLLCGCRAPGFDPDVGGVPPEKNLLILDIARAGQRLVAVGEQGSIIYSDDRGASWSMAKAPGTALLTALYFVDPRHGWAVGHDLRILATVDGGRTWSQQHAAPQESRPLLDIWFRNPREGYAVGAYGALLATTDGGASWQSRQQPEDDRHLYAVLGLPDGTLLVAGETGTLRRSVDGGLTWQPIATPYAGSFFGLLALPDDGLLLFGLRGHILRSSDRGAHWDDIPSPTQSSLLGGTLRQDGRVVLTGADGTVLESRDGGRSFSALPVQSRHLRTGVIETGHGLLLAGEAGIEPPATLRTPAHP